MNAEWRETDAFTSRRDRMKVVKLDGPDTTAPGNIDGQTSLPPAVTKTRPDRTRVISGNVYTTYFANYNVIYAYSRSSPPTLPVLSVMYDCYWNARNNTLELSKREKR